MQSQHLPNRKRCIRILKHKCGCHFLNFHLFFVITDVFNMFFFNLKPIDKKYINVKRHKLNVIIFFRFAATIGRDHTSETILSYSLHLKSNIKQQIGLCITTTMAGNRRQDEKRVQVSCQLIFLKC